MAPKRNGILWEATGRIMRNGIDRLRPADMNRREEPDETGKHAGKEWLCQSRMETEGCRCSIRILATEH
eukprot:768613-Hanusia_phi.AAC.4